MFGYTRGHLHERVDGRKQKSSSICKHSQTGNRKKFLEVEFERQAVKTKAMISALFTHRRSNIYLHKLPFTVDLTDIKSWIVFKFR